MKRTLLVLSLLGAAVVAAPGAVRAQGWGYGPPPGFHPPPPPPPPSWQQERWRTEEWRRREEWRELHRARWERWHCGVDGYGREVCR